MRTRTPRNARLVGRALSPSKLSRSFFLAAAVTASGLTASHALAATYSWDVNGSAAGTGGTGSWDNNDQFWTIDGTNYVVWPSGSVAAFGGTAGTVTLTTNETAGGLSFATGGYTIANGGGTLTLTTGSVITTAGGTDSITSAIGGSSGISLTKTGSGTLALSTSSTATLGPAVWTITGGTYSAGTGSFDSVLSIGAGNNLGAGPGTAATSVILDAGTLKITGTNLTPAIGAVRTFQVNAAGGAIVDSTGNPFLNAIVDNASSTSSLYLSNTSGTTSFSGVVSGGGGLTWNGSGEVVLSGSNSYSGGTTINGGSVSISTDANLGASGSSVSLNGGTLLSTSSISGFSHVIATGTTGGSIVTSPGTSLQLNNYGGNAASITGSGGITVSGSQLVLSANNSGYSGNWLLASGLLEIQLNGSQSLGSGSVTIASGAELALDYGNTISNAITSNGGAISFANYGGGTYAGPINLASGNTTVGLRDFYNASSDPENGTISGLISGTGSLSITSATNSSGVSGILTLSNASNSYTGGTTINSGTVAFSADGNLGAAGSTVALNGGALSATSSVSSFSHIIATGTTGGTISTSSYLQIGNFGNNGASITGSGGITVTGTQLVLSSNNSGYSGNWNLASGIVEAQLGSSTVPTTSLGSGSVTLGAAAELAIDYGNTISNPITSNGGTLSFANYGGGNYSGPITLATGITTIGLRDFYYAPNSENGTISGVISGNGAIATTGGGRLTISNAGNSYTGATTVASGTLEVSGTLGLSNVTVNSGGVLQLDSNTAIASTASITLASGSTTNLNFSSSSFQIVSSATIGGTTFNSPTDFDAANNYNGYASYFTGSTGGLEVAPAPEPTSALALAAFVSMGMLKRRRRGL